MKKLLTQPKLKEGFLMRPPSEDELESVLEVIHACSLKMTGTKEMTLENLKNDWQSPGFNPQTDLRVVVSPDGRIVAYMEIWTTDPVPVHPWLWARVHPDYEGQGIGTALMAWAEARAEQVLEVAPKDARVSLYAGSVNTYEPSKHLLDRLGMDMIRHSFRMRIEMQSQPEQPNWPQGLTLRPFDGSEEKLKQIYIADEEAFEDHFGFVKEPFEEGFKRFKHFKINDDAHDPALFFVVMDGEDIAGMSLCQKWAYDDKDLAWISDLSVRRPWRKRGLGLALLQHSFRVFWDRGSSKVGLGVDAENLSGALRLYEKAGMQVSHQFDLYEKEIRAGKELSKRI